MRRVRRTGYERNLPPSLGLAATAHARASERRARAAIGGGFRLRAHLVERRLARALRARRTMDLALVVERNAHLVELRLVRPLAAGCAGRAARLLRAHDLGGWIIDHRHLGSAQALDLVAQPRRLLEVQVGGGFAHTRLEIGDHGLEIVPDRGDLVAPGAGTVTDIDQHVVALVHALQNVGDRLLDAFRRDAVLGIVGGLLLAPPLGLGDRPLHRAGDGVGIEDDAAVDVARGAADGLDQRRLAAQKAFLVGVEDRHQGAFGNVQALAQQVDADQHVEGAEPQVADDLDALQRVDVGMHVAHADALLVQVLGEILGHALSQHGDQSAIAALRHLADLAYQVVDLGARRPDVDRRVDEAGGPDHLLGKDAPRLLQLPAARRRRDGQRLRPHGVPFLEAQRPVVHAGGQAEAVFGERRLAAEVAAVHAAELRNGDVALVDEHQGVVGHVLEQGGGRLARAAAGEIARIVLDAGARAGRLHHLEVEDGALLQPLRLQQAPGGIELVEAPAQLLLDAGDGLQQRRARRDVVRVGVDFHELQLIGLAPGERIELLDRLDLVAEQVHAPGAVLVVRRKDVDGVAAHAKAAAVEVAAGALVLQRHQVGDELALVEAVAALDGEGHGRVGLDRADAVDARYRGDDDHVVALEQGARRRMAHAVDLLVDGGFFFDIGVGARDVGLGLVIVVIGHEILDRVVGEERLELAVELRGQRLVGRKDQRRPLRRLDHLGHGVGLARAGDAEQHLVALVPIDPLDQFDDRLRLVAPGLEVGLDDEAEAAFGLVRARRPVRHPRPLAELGPSFAQEPFQRRRRGSDTRALGRKLSLLIAVAAERPGDLVADRGQRRLGHVALLRRLAESARRRHARLVGGGEIGAAVERIVGRRAQAGLRAGTGGTLPDAGSEQLVQRRRDRRQLFARRLGARRLRRVLLGMLGRIARRLAWRVRVVLVVRHRPNMGRRTP